MNILPKKKWHVRTKENVARVRRDQKKAAEEEQRIKERAELAEQEFKVNMLRKNAEQRMETMYGVRKSGADDTESDVQLAGPSGHVNFFAELEAEERKNFGTGNKEYELEKKKEQEEYEKKVGILQYLGQGSSEFTKEKPWYERVPTKKESADISTKSENRPSTHGILSKSSESVERKEKEPKKRERKHKHQKSDHEKHRKKNKRHHRSSTETLSSDEKSSDSEEAAKKQKLEKLRQERLDREAKERKRITNLLAPAESNKEEIARVIPKYNSQFNPELARQNRVR